MPQWEPQDFKSVMRALTKDLRAQQRRLVATKGLAQDIDDKADAAVQDAAAAADAAQQAAATVAGKTTVYVQPDMPEVDPSGLWIDTDDGNKTYTVDLVDGTLQWVLTRDASIQAAADAAAAATKTAEDAAKAAADAKQAADNAAAAAGEAQDAADAAGSAADAAQGTADGAAQAASQAQQAAGTAGQAASTAQQTANAAGQAASSAQQTAGSAAQAASSAQETATTAAQAASTAQQRADSANQAALDAAGIANGKGKVIYQVSKPTGANAAAGNLWIRTSDNSPWAYDTTVPGWVRVTDQAALDAASAATAANTAAGNAQTAANAAQQRADLAVQNAATAQQQANLAVQNAATAQGRADQAYQVAVAAQTAATNAQTSANGKNTIRYRSAAPTTSAADAGAADGDIWFVITNPQTGIVTGQYTWVAPTQSWLQQTLSSVLLASIDAGKITTGTLTGITITGVTITGATVTGGVVQTGVTGQRAVLSGAGIKFFDDNNQASGQINGWINGASGGLIQISPGPDTDAFYIGSYYLPVGGTAAAYSATAYHPTLYVDEMLNAATGERFQGTYVGTRTQAVGSGILSGVGALSQQGGSVGSFISMGSDGRFTLFAGVYIITIIMRLTASKATGRTFVEYIDVNDTSVLNPRGNMTPNVGEDTVAVSGAVNVPSSRLFRVQAFQTSSGSQNVSFALNVTKVG